MAFAATNAMAQTTNIAPTKPRPIAVPACVGWPGEGQFLGSGSNKGKSNLTWRYVDTNSTRPRWRFNYAYGVDDRLLVGLEYNPVVDEILPTINYTFNTGEDHGGYVISFGSSSDRIFSPDGTRSYFGTIAKGLPDLKISPYVSLLYSEWEDTFTVPFGLNWAFAPQWDAMVQNDGRNTHWLCTYKTEKANFSFLLVKGRYPGFSLGYRF